jgi:hypothetical protein
MYRFIQLQNTSGAREGFSKGGFSFETTRRPDGLPAQTSSFSLALSDRDGFHKRDQFSGKQLERRGVGGKVGTITSSTPNPPGALR